MRFVCCKNTRFYIIIRVFYNYKRAIKLSCVHNMTSSNYVLQHWRHNRLFQSCGYTFGN